jgi:hypothetical protein
MALSLGRSPAGPGRGGAAVISAVFEFCRLTSWAVGAIAAALVIVNVWEWILRAAERRK